MLFQSVYRNNGSNRATVSIFNNSHFFVSVVFQHNSVYNTNHHHLNYHQSPLSVAIFAKTGCVLTTLHMQACDSSSTCPGPGLLVIHLRLHHHHHRHHLLRHHQHLGGQDSLAAIGNLMFRKPS